ncbi:hypothetical protein DXV75_05865 [Alteromonas aestuariivivens]|uniref:PTS system glucose-specific EIIA component n=1 Tax=Alteromonas aestuariivivens TaxID=1938339 RepID=A0A3D8MB77_9ALTE|nr:PTS glucose transporter subunit IIA [Alteromonas aestuariivivens]RDV27550.1 hypothetical protein DXV75_05865 [Alteromonas aestuariivivens]
MIVTASIPSSKPEQFRHEITVLSPVSGSVVPRSNVNAPLFHSGSLGPGVCVMAQSNRILAPFPGKVVAMPEIGYELHFRAQNGLKLRIQVGESSPQLMGERWQRLVQPDTNVPPGTPLAGFDPLWLNQHQLSPVCIITVTNRRGIKALTSPNHTRLRAMEDPLFTLYL